MPDFKVAQVKKVTAKGRTYYYDRISGRRVHAPFGTAAFLVELETLRAGAAGPAAQAPPPPRPGTFGALVHAYRMGPEFAALADRTRADYNRVFDYLAGLRQVPVSDWDTPYAVRVRDRALARHRWRFANHVLAVLSLTFNWGIPRGYAAANPADKVPMVRRPRDLAQQNRAWTDHELAVVLAAAPPELALPIALGAYTGLREGDVLALPLNAVHDTPDGPVIRWRQRKTGEALEIPVHRDLLPHIAWARRRDKRKGTTLVLGKRGLPYTESGFRARLFRLLRTLRDAGRVGAGLTFHGLRHTVGARLAEAGADDGTIQSLLGHRTAAQAQRYRRDASRKRQARAAVTILERPRGNEK